MKILFLIRNHGYIRNYESTLRLLALRGHRVFLASRGAERHMAVDTGGFLDRLCSEHPSISVHRLPPRRDRWRPSVEAARALRTYTRYLGPRYRRSTKLRGRAEAQALKRGVSRVPRSRAAAGIAAAAARLFERALPNDPAIEAILTEFAPDVVVATPLVDFNSYQVDYVKAAQAAGIPTVWCVASWDNLSNKGLAPVVADRVLVWNDTQRREAIDMHGVPASRVVITGAQLFDVWFDRTPSTPREEFFARFGFPNGPVLLYLCSSLFIAPDEVQFVREWLERLRTSADPLLRGCAVLIRPHPGHAGPWADVNFDGLGPVAIWPRAGEIPIEAHAKRDYFDALYHSAAVVGINTSGMIEAAIVGRRSFTLLAPTFRETQAGTVHFEYLTSYGFLTTARSWEEHHQQLAAAIAGRGDDARSLAQALRFVRPFGIHEPSTPRVVAAIEQTRPASHPTAPLPCGSVLLRLAAAVLRPWLSGPAKDRPAAAAREASVPRGR
jgi:hypothetical protein